MSESESEKASIPGVVSVLHMEIPSGNVGSNSTAKVSSSISSSTSTI